ncbi:MAG TPA: hypothetical protein PLI09_21800 [Candidatus Hydrogenedentes bacterium]|nr:hypothetical protein [Candidatus Hydrogenedentota bacterium]
MKKDNTKHTTRRKIDVDTMRAEYDFSKAVRGATAARYAEGANVVVIEPDVARLFPNATAVNEALRALGAIVQRVPQSKKRTHATSRSR